MSFFKKSVLLVIPLIVCLLINAIIGYLRSKNFYLFPTIDYYKIRVFLSFCVELLIAFFISIGICCLFKNRKKLRLILLCIFMVIVYLNMLIICIIISSNMYHVSYTSNLNNYLICDDESIYNEIRDYYPLKETILAYKSYYSYFYKNEMFVEETCKIKIEIEYCENYFEEKERLLNNDYNEINNDTLSVFYYIDERKHSHELLVLFDDDRLTITYSYINDYYLEQTT